MVDASRSVATTGLTRHGPRCCGPDCGPKPRNAVRDPGKDACQSMDKTTKGFVIAACVVVIGYGAVPVINLGAQLLDAIALERAKSEAIAKQERKERCDREYQKEIDALIKLKNPKPLVDWQKDLVTEVPPAITEDVFKVKVDEQREIRRKCLEGKN